MGWLEVERPKTPRRKEFCGRTMVPLMGKDQPRRSDSNDERRLGYTRQYQKPEFESQLDPVLNTVIVLKCDKTEYKKSSTKM